MWRAKYRLPDGHQVQRAVGKVWTERGRPPEGYFTKRTAEAWLRDVLNQAERGVLPGMVRTGRTFGDAADEYLRYLIDDRQRKASTVRDARSVIANHLLAPFGARAGGRPLGPPAGGGAAAIERDQAQGDRDLP